MDDVEGNFLCRLRGESGISLAKVADRLLPYANGISQKHLRFGESSEIFTDTATIYLPERVTEFVAEDDNFLFYKLAVTAQLCLIKLATYNLKLSPDPGQLPVLLKRFSAKPRQGDLYIDDFCQLFPEPALAEDLLTLAEGFRVSGLMKNKFRGLWNDTAALREELAARRGPTGKFSEKTRVVEYLTRSLITGKSYGDQVGSSIMAIFTGHTSSFEKTAAIYDLLAGIEGPYQQIGPLSWLGRLRPAEAREVMARQRGETRQKFVEALAAILPDRRDPVPESDQDHEGEGGSQPRLDSDVLTALLIPPGSDSGEKDSVEPARSAGSASSLVIGGPEDEIPEALRNLAADIVNDLGRIPDEYIAAAQGFAGSGSPALVHDQPVEGEALRGATTYAEWDYRRGGFRKGWCLLNEKKVQAVKGSFVGNTLDKYRGLLIKLKKQFEMLRSSERFMKRQRDGDDIDLDAVVESISDQHAGLPGSEKTFIKLNHDGRDIGVMFLIDMSASTEGWVGEALKEALILMGESLEVLGDRYAIAGFSGMRRTRSEFFHIKDFSEPYNDDIRGRIAAISPQEYTRMGPPLRHATGMLKEIDARVRLLIVLSDGKPEDYDDYKGKYAIEDTRHALIEAKAAGIHPFCITIDKQAHDYLAHMYGEVNYIFLDKVSDLPIRMPAIYRNLTT
jgi:nitric oxide reductase NorD protein